MFPNVFARDPVIKKQYLPGEPCHVSEVYKEYFPFSIKSHPILDMSSERQILEKSLK